MDFDNLHQILRSLYLEMTPLCSDMAGVAKGIAGLGALIYVASRVWQSLARTEPIDVYPLLRPFAIGFCIMFFPSLVLGTVNMVLSPVVIGTNQMLETQTFDMEKYQALKDELEYEAMKRNPETAFLVSNEEFDNQLEELGWSPTDLATMSGMYIERSLYNMKKNIRDFFREILELLFQAAALVIDTIRTFFLIVLSILGPIAFAISVYDGFQSTMTQWFSRYITVYFWLPVSDLFSSILARIQVLMLQNDIVKLQADASLFHRSFQWGLSRVYDYRYHRVFHNPYGCRVDNHGRWNGQLRKECYVLGRQGRFCGSRNGWCICRKYCRKIIKKVEAPPNLPPAGGEE